MVTLDDAMAILEEFVQDVEAVGTSHVVEELEWPDLGITYGKARVLVHQFRRAYRIPKRSKRLSTKRSQG